MKRNIGYPRRDKKPLVEITRGNNSEHTSGTGLSTSKENFLPKTTTTRSPVIAKIVFPIERLQKKYKLKEIPEELENLNMPDSDDELYDFFNKSARVKDQKKPSFSSTTREQPSPKRPLEEKKRDSQATFRIPSPITFSQPIERDSIEYFTRKSTKFQRPSPIRSFGQDNYGSVEASRKLDTFQRPSPIKSFGQDNHGSVEAPRKLDIFRIPSPMSISKNEPKVQSQSQSSSRILQFTESSIIIGKKRVIKPITEIIDEEDDEFNLTSCSNIKSNIMDKAKSVEKYDKNFIRAKNSNGTASAFTNPNETVSSKIELKTKNVQSSLIDDFYEPSKKRDGSLKRSRKNIEQKNSGIPLSKDFNEKPDKKSVKVMSRNEKRKDLGIVNKLSPLNKSSRRISSDDDFIINSPHKPKSDPKIKRNDVRARLPHSNSDDSDFLDKSPRKSSPKKRRPKKKGDSFRVSSYQSNSDGKKRYNLRRKPNDDFMDISPQNTEIIDDESATLNNQSEEFRAPSPTRNKYADLPEIDLLSEEEAPIQSNSRKRREGSAEYKHCPFCKEPIPFPLPERIRTYLIKINPSAQDKLSDQTQMPSPSILLQHSLNVIDQFEFCRLHDAETHIVPEGLKKNYPINIDFDILPKRVEKLIPELMLIIKGEKKSLYRDVALSAYQELGRARARKPTILMGRFQKFQPGYYGSKGASIIFSSLVSHFLDTNILTMDMTKPQEPLEYLNQVLVPETAIILISQDRGGISFEEARKTMEDSLEFGMYVHDIDEELDE